MSALFQRRCTLVLVPPVPGSLTRPPVSSGIQITDLRVQFKVQKTITKEPNTAEIQVFNLAPETRKQLQSRGTLCILMAGYEGKLSQIFSGDSRTIDHVRDGADWTTKIQCGDGEFAMRFAISKGSYGPGTPKAKVLIDTIKAMVADPGNAVDKLANVTEQYVSGFSMNGKASVELESQLKGLGLEYSIQDGRLQILGDADTTKESAVLLDAQAGLVGSPQHGTPEIIGGPGIVKIKTLLNANCRPGRQAKIQSLNLNGFFKIMKVTHAGDTHGGEWYTDCETRAL